MKTNCYTCYQTNVPNILGGYMTYPTLSAAMKSGANCVYAVTKVKKDNNLGIDTDGYLFKTLWRTLVYKHQ
jgi:hypothetical protein